MNKYFEILISWFKKIFLRTEQGRLALAMVVVPSLVVAFYMSVFLPNEYESSAVVLVKESDIAGGGEVGLLALIGISAGSNNIDEQLLQAFVVSPDLLIELEDELGVKAHYSKSWDFIFGLNTSDTKEDILKFYLRKVTIKIDANSGLLRIAVRAYSPDFAKLMTDTILQKSESFINESSNRIANREMQFALEEIKRSQNLLKKAKKQLLLFQDQHNLVSPDSEGQSLITIVYGMESELAKAQAELGQALRILNKNAPKIRVLQGRIDALTEEISGQKRRLIGSNGVVDDLSQMNKLNAQFQNLTLDLELATTLYKSALSAHELARMQAGKQLKHLVVASRPYLPEAATYPKRLYWWLTSLIVLSALFGISRIVIVSMREHRD